MKKRSRYRPRTTLPNPLTFLRPAPAAERQRITLRFLTAIENCARGEAPAEDDWRDISDAINTVEVLALHFGKLSRAEVMPVINAAIEGMVHAKNRFLAGQGMRFDAAGLQAVRRIVEIYGDCMEGLTEREMVLAQQEVARRTAQVLAARAPKPEAIVL